MSDFPETLLMTPPCLSLYGKLRAIAPKSPPLGLAYIAAELLKNGYKVRIVDTFAKNLTWKGIINRIGKSDAEIFGITCLTSTLREVLFMTKIIRKYRPNSLVIVGGSHPTADTRNMMEKYGDLINIAVIGEGELTILELYDVLKKYYMFGKPFNCQSSEFFSRLRNICGIAYKFGNRVIITGRRPYIENLDSIPFPAYHLLPMEKYRPPTKFPQIRPFSAIITSRGCPFGCRFCAASTICGRRPRERSPKNIEAEVRLLVNKFGIRYIWINDSTFTLNPSRALKVGRIFRKYGVKWACNTRVDTVTRSLLKGLAETGCNLVEFGIESVYGSVLRYLGKGFDIDKIVNALYWAKEAGLLISGAFIIGVPGETEDKILKMVEFIRKSPVNFLSLSILTAYPGTSIYREFKKLGYLKSEFEEYESPKLKKPVIELPGLPSQKLVRLWKHLNYRFYLHPSYFKKLLPHVVKEPLLIKSLLLDIKAALMDILGKDR